jgi:cytoplasmic iron level regulating protein YaaA (DUF328/UPF0246 family)
MLIVLSPAKTLDENASTPSGATLTSPRFFRETHALVAALQTLSEKELAALMDISPKLAALNHARYANFPASSKAKSCKPAAYMFRGDVYTGLDIDSLPSKALPYMQQHLRILSGLYGVLRPLDAMYPYRLEMGTSLKNPRGKDLYAYWGSQIAETLNHDAEAAGTDTLINLASQEYAGAIDRRALKLHEVEVQFKEKKGNKLQVIGLFAKKARGQMARYILERQPKKPKDLQGFCADGYRFEPELSTASSMLFVRG